MSIVKIKEYVHYKIHGEDTKHGIFVLYLNHEIEEWMKENIEGDWDICSEEVDYYDHIIPPPHTSSLVFENDMDALAFKLRWS